jgi:hypothetical protein
MEKYRGKKQKEKDRNKKRIRVGEERTGGSESDLEEEKVRRKRNNLKGRKRNREV